MGFNLSTSGKNIVLALAACFILSPPGAAIAETMSSALARAYDSNPEMDRQRANVRVRDEDAPKAMAGMRPNANVQASVGPQYTDINIPFPNINTPFIPLRRVPITFSDGYVGYPRGATLNMSQTLFDGGRTSSAVRQAELGIFAARAVMRSTEQAVLQNAAAAYMNTLRDTAILALRKNNVAVLETQLGHTRERNRGGDVTSTDVAQAEAALAQGRSEYYAAQEQLNSSAANYRQIIGLEPQHLEPARSVEQLLPKSLDAAIAIALTEHPSIVAAQHQTDAADHAVKVAEAALSPTVSVAAQVSQQQDSVLGLPGSRQFGAGAAATLNVPLYQGGGEYASIRQAKEQLGQARFNTDVELRSVRAAVVSSYGRLKTVKAQIISDQAAVKAAESALKGVRDEAAFGERTTQDVLNAQQSLLNARVNLIVSQRDSVVASYVALSSIGRLSASILNLNVTRYDPAVHFEQVNDQWFGVDTSPER